MDLQWHQQLKNSQQVRAHVLQVPQIAAGQARLPQTVQTAEHGVRTAVITADVQGRYASGQQHVIHVHSGTRKVQTQAIGDYRLTRKCQDGKQSLMRSQVSITQNYRSI